MIQHLADHLAGVSVLAGRFAKKVGLAELGEVLGLVHDVGKASKEFDQYIRSATGLIEPDQDEYVDFGEARGKVDHSTAGAQLVYQALAQKGPESGLLGEVLALCLASHHSGLIDCLSPDGRDNLGRRLGKDPHATHRDEALEYLDSSMRERFDSLLTADLARKLASKLRSLREAGDSQETFAFKAGLLVRFLLSCLIDADRLDTANFEMPEDALLRGGEKPGLWGLLLERLDRHLEGIIPHSSTDELRRKVSVSCGASAAQERGVFRLTVPTGGGKTLASLRFALNHALHHGMERIIYAIPYTTIIDQNARAVREILEPGESHGDTADSIILEHHSNLTPEKETHRQHLLAENWDAPITFTTNVQILEALFGAGTRGVRRLHQLANAVIVFDEIQTLPVRCVHMFNAAVRFLIHGCHSTVVLCTATQPLLDEVEPPQRALSFSEGSDLVPDPGELFRSLRRVAVHDRRQKGKWSEEALAELATSQLVAAGSVLVIMNTKRSARSLYERLAGGDTTELYHLSTNMCPAHRFQALRGVREGLSQGTPVICVSTQLVEAGIDLDFGCVIRSLAGLDSIAQAAGRCNRHGQRSSPGTVVIVNPVDEDLTHLRDIRVGVEKAERVLDEFREKPGAFENDPLGLRAMQQYYRYYFHERQGEMSYPVGAGSIVGRDDNLFELLSLNRQSVSEFKRTHRRTPSLMLRQSFHTASSAFQAIDSMTQGIIVPWGDGGTLVERLFSAQDTFRRRRLLREAQQYSVNVFSHEFVRLQKDHAIYEAGEGIGVFCLRSGLYNDQVGLDVQSLYNLDSFIV